MSCLTSDENCVNTTQLKPGYEIIVVYNNNKDFCTQVCKQMSIKNYLIEDIQQGLYSEETLAKCSYCSSSYNKWITLSCGHLFCYECMRRVFESHIKCPCCRIKLILNMENEEVNDNLQYFNNEDHIYFIDTCVKLLNSLSYNIDKGILEEIYLSKTGRTLEIDLNLLKAYLNLYNN